MNSASAPYVIIAVLVIGLVAGALYFKQSNNLMRDEIGRLSDEYELLTDTVNVKRVELELRNEEIDQLQTELADMHTIVLSLNESKLELESDKSKLESKLYGIQSEIERTKEDLTEYETEVTDSMAWFRTNADITQFSEWNTFRQQLKGWCTERIEERCKIRLSCPTFVTDYLEGFHYQYDEATTGKSDFLLDLGKIYENKGGDCEDYSILAVAELNYLIDYCEERGSPEIEFIAFTSEEGEKHYVEDTGKYYMPNSKDYKLPKELTNYHVVCGTFPAGYDPNSNSPYKVGHCVVGFSDREVKSSDDVTEFLENSILVEPQSGAFLVDLREPSAFHIPKNGEEKGEFPITIVITGKDLYLYGDFKGEKRWHGYEDYVTEISKLTKELERVNVN